MCHLELHTFCLFECDLHILIHFDPNVCFVQDVIYFMGGLHLEVLRRHHNHSLSWTYSHNICLKNDVIFQCYLQGTASRFDSIFKMREKTNPKNLVYQLLYSEKIETEATKWGNMKENLAREFYKNLTGNEVSQSGLIVNENFPWLAGSPDGLIINSKDPNEDGILEINVPISGKK